MARGFAHIGVIKALESQGIVADIVTNTTRLAVRRGAYLRSYAYEFILQLLVVSCRVHQVVAAGRRTVILA